MKNRIEKEFNIIIDEKSHKVMFKQSKKNSKAYIEVDDTLVSSKLPDFFSTVQEYFFEMDSHKCIIVTNNKKVDIIVDNISVETGEKYVQLLPMPKWSWIFICICIAIPVVTRGGGIPAAIGILRSNGMC